MGTGSIADGEMSPELPESDYCSFSRFLPGDGEVSLFFEDSRNVAR